MFRLHDVGHEAAATRLLADMVYIGRYARFFKTTIAGFRHLEWSRFGFPAPGK
jgi:hypothetical protein